jgi:hypothetical protein
MINRMPFKKRLGRLDANKIAVFYSDTKTSVWSLGKGLCTTLSSMGYEVLEAPASAMPEQHTMESQDMILVSGPEYLWERLRAKYPNWEQFKAKKYGWMHETVEREDYVRNPIARDGTLPVEHHTSSLLQRKTLNMALFIFHLELTQKCSHLPQRRMQR